MGILTNITKQLIEGGFDLFGKYIDRKRQEGIDKKAFEALAQYQNYINQQYSRANQNQGGVLAQPQLWDNPYFGRGVLPLDSNVYAPDTGLQNNRRDQQHQPILNYETGEMYFPLAGPGNFYLDSRGNLVQP